MPSITLPLSIAIPGASAVSGILNTPQDALACYVFAHGAGAGMTHSFMEAMATNLAQRKVATLRFQFPFMEQGSKRVDSPKVAHAAVRAAVEEAGRRMPGVPLFAGGKSFGGRMTSQAQAIEPLANVKGLVFVGFPLHPAGKPSDERAAHLKEVGLPMLFLQGFKDKLTDICLIQNVVAGLEDRATLKTVAEADHSFHVLVRSGRTDEQVQQELLGTMVGWMVQK